MMDPPRSLPDHLLRRRLAGEEEPLEVDPHHPVEVLFPDLEDVAGMQHRGVADHHVDTAVRLDRLRDQRFDLRAVSHVAGDEHRLAPRIAQRLRRRFALLGLNVGEHDLRPVGCETLGARESDALRGAGDDDRLS